MNVDVSVMALKVTDRGEHTDVLDATDFGDAMLETKQVALGSIWDNQVGMGRS